MEHVKRIVVSGLLAHALGYVLAGFVALVFGMRANVANPWDIPQYIWFVTMAGTAAIMYVAAKWYFRDVTIPVGALQGCIYGFWVLMISLVLDLLVVLPKLFMIGIDTYLAYYTHPFFLLTALIVLVIPALVGMREQKYRPSPGVVQD